MKFVVIVLDVECALVRFEDALLFKDVSLADARESDITEQLISEEIVNELIHVELLEQSRVLANDQPPVVRVEWLQHLVHVLRLGNQTPVESSQGSNILIVFILYELKHDLVLRLNHQHLHQQTQKLRRSSRSTVATPDILQFYRPIYKGLRGKRETLLLEIRIVVDFQPRDLLYQELRVRPMDLVSTRVCPVCHYINYNNILKCKGISLKALIT